jgi:hypothetical protein
VISMSLHHKNGTCLCATQALSSHFLWSATDWDVWLNLFYSEISTP